MASRQARIHALSQRVPHTCSLSVLDNPLQPTYFDRVSDSSGGTKDDTFRSSLAGAAYAPIPTPPYTYLSDQPSPSAGMRLGGNENQPALQRPDGLISNRYDPMCVHLDPSTLAGSTTSPVAGTSHPFPPQSRISDLDFMFNRKSDMSGTLPVMSGGVPDTGAYGYNFVQGTETRYDNSSASSSLMTGMGSVAASDPCNFHSPGCNLEFGAGDSVPGPSSFLQCSYPYGATGGLSSSVPSSQISCRLASPWQLNTPRQNTANYGAPSFESQLLPTSVLNPSTSSGFQSRPIPGEPFSASSVSVEHGSRLSPDDELEERRLTAEDMADDDELAELREIESGGSSRRAERRRMRNKLAQRAFRARAKVSRKDVASRLIEAEASTTIQNKELDMFRTMVHTLQTENSQLKNQMKDSNDKRRMSSDGSGRQGDDLVKLDDKGAPRRFRKESRDGV